MPWFKHNFSFRLPGRTGTFTAKIAATTTLLLLLIPTQAQEMMVRTVLFPIRQAILSANVESTVGKYAFREGESFQQNDLLIELDQSNFIQQLEKAKASAIEATASYDFAQRNLERTKDMFNQGIQGEQDVERCELELSVNLARLNFQKANLILTEKALDYCNIRAPFNGRLIKKHAQEFEFVRIGQQLAYIIDDSKLLAAMMLPSDLKNQITLNQELEIVIDETNTIHKATISEISGEIDPASRTFEIKAIIDNSDHLLAVGMSGVLKSIKLPAGKEQKNE